MKLRSLAGSMLALALAMPITSAWAAPQIQGKQISVQASICSNIWVAASRRRTTRLAACWR